MDLTGWTQIWLYSVADGNVRPVTEGAASHFQPAWGPEPATVYYASDRGGSRSFWRQRLGSSGAPVADPQPLMVPSSQAGQMTFGGQHPRFAYVVEGGTAGIFRLGWNPATLTAAGPPTLVTPAGERAVEPAVSLDGRWLAYTTGEALRDDIAVLDLMSGARSRRVITRGGPRDHAAAWLGGPAQGLLFWSNRDSQLALWRVQMDGGRLERVPGPAGTDRAALPVGGSPVALSTEQSVRLAEIRSDGALTEGRALPTPPGVSRLHPLAWSGDRSRMVARGTMTDGGSRLWMWDARASQWQDTGASNARQAAFFRDGQGLLLLEGSTLRALDLETSKSHIVFRHGGLHSFAVGREDSRALFVALSQPERSLWVASLGRR